MFNKMLINKVIVLDLELHNLDLSENNQIKFYKNLIPAFTPSHPRSCWLLFKLD